VQIFDSIGQREVGYMKRRPSSLGPRGLPFLTFLYYVVILNKAVACVRNFSSIGQWEVDLMLIIRLENKKYNAKVK